MAKSSVSRTRGKAGGTVVNYNHDRPGKPYPEFPMVAHPSGHWAKKIKGRLYYFGPWGKRVDGEIVWIDDEGNWKPALERYKAEVDNIHAGRPQRAKAVEGTTVAELCEQFLNAKRRLMENAEITPRTFADYKRVTDRMVDVLGVTRVVSTLEASDFDRLRAKIAETCGPVRLAGEVLQSRMVFKYGWDAALLTVPVRYGASFKPPAKRVLRRHKATSGPKLLDAAEVRKLLDAATPQVKAMILLAINCGFGNADCGTLPEAAVDLAGGWIDFPRPKTGIERRCPLWPETVAALRQALEIRPDATDAADANLVFVTKYGQSWAKDSRANPISHEFRKLAQREGVYRKGVAFYALRHTFATIGGGSRDQVAVNSIMGHVDATMAATYRERIEDERLQAVADHVRGWLFGQPAKRKGVR
jgi:integrase